MAYYAYDSTANFLSFVYSTYYAYQKNSAVTKSYVVLKILSQYDDFSEGQLKPKWTLL